MRWKEENEEEEGKVLIDFMLAHIRSRRRFFLKKQELSTAFKFLF